MHAVKLVEAGDELGLVLPDDLLARLKLKEGDSLQLTELPTSLLLTLCRERDAGVPQAD
jgi:antitoxin component of MazEF toxin-antitoxin module